MQYILYDEHSMLIANSSFMWQLSSTRVSPSAVSSRWCVVEARDRLEALAPYVALVRDFNRNLPPSSHWPQRSFSASTAVERLVASLALARRQTSKPIRFRCWRHTDTLLYQKWPSSSHTVWNGKEVAVACSIYAHLLRGLSLFSSKILTEFLCSITGQRLTAAHACEHYRYSRNPEYSGISVAARF